MQQAVDAFLDGTTFPVIPELAAYWEPMDTTLQSVFDDGADPADVLAEAYFAIAEGIEAIRPGLACLLRVSAP